MKLAFAVAGAGALCAGTDAFVPSTPVTGSFGVSKSAVFASSITPVPAGRAGEVVMSLGGGGSKKGGVPRGVSSKIVNLFRGTKSKG